VLVEKGLLMNREMWNQRYDTTELVWTANPNQFLVEEVEHLSPGRALDVACGEGRNAVWLATKGWESTGVDFSRSGLAKAEGLARANDVSVEWIEADALEWSPEPEHFDLILAAYVHLPNEERTALHRSLVAGLAVGGLLLVIAHDSENLASGFGGPQEPEVLFNALDVVNDLDGLDLEIEKAGQVNRTVMVDEAAHMAIDTLVRARRLS
jgi:SAM-dependent methyltransferase